MNTKVLIKVDNSSEQKWVHLCYIDSDLYQEFLNGETSDGLNRMLSQWCAEDFKVQLPMTTLRDLATLKLLVRSHFEQKYPELFLESRTDRQGWMRVWFTQKVKGAINDRK